MELESSCLLCKKSVAKKRPLHSVNNLHLISTLVGLLDDIVDNTVLPAPSCFRSLEKANKLREQLKQAIESGQLIGLTSTLTYSSVVAVWISSAEKRANCGFCSMRCGS